MIVYRQAMCRIGGSSMRRIGPGGLEIEPEERFYWGMAESNGMGHVGNAGSKVVGLGVTDDEDCFSSRIRSCRTKVPVEYKSFSPMAARTSSGRAVAEGVTLRLIRT